MTPNAEVQKGQRWTRDGETLYVRWRIRDGVWAVESSNRPQMTWISEAKLRKDYTLQDATP